MYTSLLKKYWVYIVGIIFALAVAFGILQSRQDPYSGYPGKSVGTAPAEKDIKAYYQQSKEIQAQQKAETTATFFAAGDIMLSRSVADAIAKANDPHLPFSRMKEILNSTNFNFANLESPVSGKSTYNKSGSMVFNAPQGYAAMLKTYNFQIVNLANNHALDQGTAGLFHTMDYLTGLDIAYTGTGKTLQEAWQPKTVEANGIKICFIGASYASINDNGKTTNDYVARIEDTEKLKSSILNLKASCDFIVATMHAGTEYTRKPNSAQTAFAHAALDAGADMVIGAHPHWVQTIERYCPKFPSSPNEERIPEGQMRLQCPNPKYIFYSLGNFIFDQEWSQDTKEGLTLKIQISKNNVKNAAAPGAAGIDDLQGPKLSAHIKQIELIPVIIENYSTPRPATPEEAKKILEKIGETETILK